MGEQERLRLTAERYGADAAAYKALWGPVLQPLARGLLDELPLAVARRVLDIGAGVGLLLPDLKRAAPDALVVGADLTEAMLALAPPAFPRAVMDAQALALAGGSFDVAVTFFVLQHVPSPAAAFASAARVLRPGGALGTITWAAQPDYEALDVWTDELDSVGAAQFESIAHPELVDHPEKVRSLMTGAGLEPVRIWRQSGEYRMNLEVFLERMTALGLNKRRLGSLGPSARRAFLARVHECLGRLEPDAFLEPLNMVYAVGGVPH